VVKENGFYRYCKDENFCEFAKKVGMPDGIVNNLKDMTLCWKSCDTGFKVVECFGDNIKICYQSKFDEEYSPTCAKEGAMPAMKIVTVKCGPGKYRSVAKAENGSHAEYNFEFNDKGLCLCAKNLKTGDCAKVMLKRCINTSGTWKPVSIIGVKEAMTKVCKYFCYFYYF
jgi:hypothetical protein